MKKTNLPNLKKPKESRNNDFENRKSSRDIELQSKKTTARYENYLGSAISEAA